MPDPPLAGPVQPAVAGGSAPGQPQQNQPNPLQQFLTAVTRAIFIYYLISWFTGAGRTPQTPTKPVLDPTTGHVVQKQISQYLPIWKQGISTDLYVYLSEDPVLSDFKRNGDASLVWTEKGMNFGDFEVERKKDIVVPVSENVQNNGSLWAHVYLTEKGYSPDPYSPHFSEDKTLYYRKLLTRFMPKKKSVIKKKLVAGDKKEEVQPEEEELDIDEETGEPPIISYWWPNMTINVIAESNAIPLNTPPLVLQHLRLNREGDRYYPIFYCNDFWMLSDQLMPINDTVKSLNLSMSFYPISMWKFQLYTQFTESFRLQNTMMGVASSETDEIKRMLLETNPILLDIEFWRKRKDLEGLSFRAILLNIIFQLIIFLYLLDNETSWMVVISSGVGLLIEAWKIQKTVIVQVDRTKWPYIKFVDRVKPSKKVSITKKYDEIAFKYLSYVMYPLLVGYTIYSLIYEEHKGWYSFVVGTLVGFVYMFGFITMTPQLFINYKLKSVAHMPWKTFMYKALNTFIDDLFAFVIKMPTLHRLACLRDDVVFLIYLYQKWIYPEDKRRRNEFGQIGEEPDDQEEEDVDEQLLLEAEKKELEKSSSAPTKEEIAGSARAETEAEGARRRVGGTDKIMEKEKKEAETKEPVKKDLKGKTEGKKEK
ncbi:hypothetical protein HK102_003622 [Quaeritorhiza haematococci]|nr:hypothetical protein HK102_003622 [Quaeritorhiza haematococci]